MLIDLADKHVWLAFGKDLLFSAAWDQSGQRVAYSSAKHWTDDSSLLVVTDIAKLTTLFRTTIDQKHIYDIAWAPNGKYLAVLVVKHTYSLNPFALLSTISGHPVGYKTYYLAIYDLTGKLIYPSGDTDMATFSAGWASGRGALLWVEKEESPPGGASQ